MRPNTFYKSKCKSREIYNKSKEIFNKSTVKYTICKAHYVKKKKKTHIIYILNILNYYCRLGT